MKYKHKITIVFLVLVIFTCAAGGCSCKVGLTEYEEGDYIYTVRDISSEEVSTIEGLTEAGAEKKILVLPRTLGGHRVIVLGRSVFWGYRGEWESDNLEKLFVPYDIQSIIYFNKCPNLKKIIMVKYSMFFDQVGKRQYMTSKNISLIQDETNYFGGIEYCSNISYMYNYEESPNYGYYWIDDLDYGSKIDWQPAEPTRKGYTFGGWYKEEECINAWDFASDTLPQEEKTDEGIVKYRETRLYAKWD